MKDKRILITGNRGFIGTYLEDRLRKRFPHNVYNTRDIKSGTNIFSKDNRFHDIVFHLASYTDVNESMVDPEEYLYNNIFSTLKIIQDNPDAKIILAGSVAGMNVKSPYGLSKYAQIRMGEMLHKNCTSLIFPNVFAHDDNGVVGNFINNSKATVCGDGKQTRNFVYVGDIVEALIKAVEWEPKVYLLASPDPVKINELAEATGKEIEYIDERDGDIYHSNSVNSTPNWEPQVNVIDYIKEQCQKN